MTRKISSITGIEILNSRGDPTLRVRVQLDDGTTASASVPTGSTVGGKEAVQIRDGDSARYDGKGVRRAVAIIEETIAPKLTGFRSDDQSALDRFLVELDGTENKSGLGGNTLIGISMAVARAAADSQNIPLYRYLGGLSSRHLPMPLLNVINGGAQAPNRIDFEEFMIIPIGAPSFSEAMRWSAETFVALGNALRAKGHLVSLGDSGGYVPDIGKHKEIFQFLIEAIEAAGLRPGIDMALGIDAAATSFYRDGKYDLPGTSATPRSQADMIGLYGKLVLTYPIIYLEDGLAENDWGGFRALNDFFGHNVQIVGDDLYATNPKLLAQGIEKGTTNAALIRLDQIGTVSEAIEAIQLCRQAGWNFIVADRGADTEDTFIADFAVAMGGQIKAGSVMRGERVAKYNRLLEIESELGDSAVFRNPFALRDGQKKSLWSKIG